MCRDIIIDKTNTLITSKYDLSLEEQRIILILSSTVKPDDEDFKTYKFKIMEFMRMFNIKNKSQYTNIPKITKDLMKKVFEIRNENKITQISWFSSVEYEKGSGIVELQFSPKLKPFLLELKEFYIKHKIKNILDLNGKYSIRMYEILKSNQFKKIVEIKIDDLKEILKVNKDSYSIYQNFKKRIILHSQKELKEKTDIRFKFEEIKTSRKITSIKFFIYENKLKQDNFKNNYYDNEY